MTLNLQCFVSFIALLVPGTAFAASGAPVDLLYAVSFGGIAGVIAGVLCWKRRERLAGCIVLSVLVLALLMGITASSTSYIPPKYGNGVRGIAEVAAQLWLVLALPTFAIFLSIILIFRAALSENKQGMENKNDNAP